MKRGLAAVEIQWANLFRVPDIRFSKCSDIDNVYRRKHSNRQNLPLAAFAGHFGAFAIHGSGLALGNVLLPSCCVSCRTLRKSNILHSHKLTHCISTAANPLNLRFKILIIYTSHFRTFDNRMIYSCFAE